MVIAAVRDRESLVISSDNSYQIERRREACLHLRIPACGHTFLLILVARRLPVVVADALSIPWLGIQFQAPKD
jgi:hypothetical protein